MADFLLLDSSGDYLLLDSGGDGLLLVEDVGGGGGIIPQAAHYYRAQGAGMQYLRADTLVKVVVGPVVAVGDAFTPVTTLSLATADEAELMKHDAAAVTDISGNTFAAITGMDGYYNLTLTAAQVDTEGMLKVGINDDSLCLPVANEFTVIAANMYDAMFGAAGSNMADTLGTPSDFGSGTLSLAANLQDLADDGTAVYDRSTDSMQAIRDRGDTAWITGGGGGLTQVLNVKPVIPVSIDLADTATVRIGLMLTNALDDLPTTAEITPGTIDIHRKAANGTAWSAVVTAGACSEQAGMIYYDEVFDSGSSYAEGDSIRFTFKSQSITADANTHDVTDANGVMFQTHIRHATVPANMVQISGSAPAADLLEDSMLTCLKVTVSGAGSTVSSVDTSATGHGDDTFIGRSFIFLTGALAYEGGDITDYVSSTGAFTFAASTFTAGAADGDTAIIV